MTKTYTKLCAPIQMMIEKINDMELSAAIFAHCLEACFEIKVSRMKVNRWVNGKVDPSWPEGEALVQLVAMLEYMSEVDGIPLRGNGFGKRIAEWINAEVEAEVKRDVESKVALVEELES